MGNNSSSAVSLSLLDSAPQAEMEPAVLLLLLHPPDVTVPPRCDSPSM